MKAPRFRIRTLMLAVAVLAADLALCVAIIRPSDAFLGDYGVPAMSRFLAAALIANAVTWTLVAGLALLVTIVRRARTLRSLLHRDR